MSEYDPYNGQKPGMFDKIPTWLLFCVVLTYAIGCTVIWWIWF